MLGWAVLPIAWCRVLSPNDIEWLAPVTEKLNLLPSSPKDTFVVRLATPEFCNALLTSSVINLPNSWIVWNWFLIVGFTVSVYVKGPICKVAIAEFVTGS